MWWMMLRNDGMSKRPERALENYSVIAAVLAVGLGVLSVFLKPGDETPLQAVVIYALAMFLLGLFAFFAGIIGLKRCFTGKKKILSYLKALLGTGLSAVFLFLLAMMIPSNPVFQPRVKQNEAKLNLRAIYTLYRAYHLEMDTFPDAAYINKGGNSYDCFEIVGFNPELHHRYNYNCMDTEFFRPPQRNSPCPPEVKTITSKDSFTVAACGNLDSDSTIDVWTINDAGELTNIIDDVKD
jgi:hypothetical protein